MGTYQHNIDKKGRVFIPAKMRSDLGERFVITYSVQRKKCLAVYPEESWKKFAATVSSGMNMDMAKDYFRHLCAGAEMGECDAQGRVLIPQKLREYAELGETATIVGVFDSAEIWSEENYQKESQSFGDDDSRDYLSNVTMSLD